MRETPLGAFWEPEATVFRVWAPNAKTVAARLYASWREEAADAEEHAMTRGSDGTWQVRVVGALAGRFYTIVTDYEGRGTAESVDPYARAVGPGGRRGYLFDSRSTDPEGWNDDRAPALEHILDSVVYELHVRDASSLPSSGIARRGKFLGLTEEGTVSPDGLPTGLDHIASLGVTHVHLLPVYDFDGTDDLEYRPDDYNWGYNPRNFNALKPAYSTDPQHPEVGIREFKQLVAAFHRRGLRVVLDMVYNHTFTTDSMLNRVYPSFYYRMHGSEFSNGSGCGNELATEKPMVRRYILDSLRYWKEEFHVDGFRFDLMGLYDVDTVNEIARTFRERDPAFLIYGEGWTGGLSTLPDGKKALKAHAAQTPGVAYFSDENRDALKGHVFDADKPGFVNGGAELESAVRFAASGCTAHPALGRSTWASGPAQVVNYAAAHDNHTLIDKLARTNPDQSFKERAAMARLAHAAVFLSQGIPFLHAGEEFLRTKGGEENSYDAPDSVNGLDWTALARHRDTVEYVRGLLALRRQRSEFRLRDAASICAQMSFPELLEPQMAAWRVGGVYVVLNAHANPRDVHLPAGNWTVVTDASGAGTRPRGAPHNQMIVVPGRTAIVLVASP